MKWNAFLATVAVVGVACAAGAHGGDGPALWQLLALIINAGFLFLWLSRMGRPE